MSLLWMAVMNGWLDLTDEDKIEAGLCSTTVTITDENVESF